MRQKLKSNQYGHVSLGRQKHQALTHSARSGAAMSAILANLRLSRKASLEFGRDSAANASHTIMSQPIAHIPAHTTSENAIRRNVFKEDFLGRLTSPMTHDHLLLAGLLPAKRNQQEA